MKRFCPICDAPSQDGSLFCNQHRAQAASFATAFAPRGDAAPAPAQKPKTRAVEEDAELESLRQRLEEVIESSATLERKGGHRYPEIDVYYLHGELRARVYYTVKEAEAPAGEPDPGAWQRALDREVFATFAKLFKERQDDLRRGSLQVLGLELATHDGVVRVVGRSAQRPKAILASFVQEGERFVEKAEA